MCEQAEKQGVGQGHREIVGGAAYTAFMRIVFLIVCCLAPLCCYAQWFGGLPDAARFSSVIESGDVNKAQSWLDAGLAPDFEGEPIGTGVMIAAWTGNLAMLELFHARGADLNRRNRHGEQALLHAAWRGQLAALRWLLDHGARLERGGSQWSALHYAAFAGHAEVVDELLGRGAEVNARAPNGSTPLMMAAREGREGIAVRLLQAGADPALRSEWDLDALAMAERNNNLRIARLIQASDPALIKRPPPATAPPPLRSQPVPDATDALLAKARGLEAAGKRAEALAVYRAALAELRGKEAGKTSTPPRQLTGVRIQARRTAPSEQRAELQFAVPAASNLPKVGVGEAGPGSTSSTVKLPAPSADELLAQAHAAEAQGRRKDALELFRRAAALVRAGQ